MAVIGRTWEKEQTEEKARGGRQGGGRRGSREKGREGKVEEECRVGALRVKKGGEEGEGLASNRKQPSFLSPAPLRFCRKKTDVLKPAS